MAVRTLIARAYAKINVSLRILGVRPDGYHELRTVFQSVSVYDTLTFRAARGPLAIECDDPACPADRTNLVWRAADAVWRAAKRPGRPRGLIVRLEKQIPMEAGLGGGSSDAAAALRGCAAFWRITLNREQQLAIAMKLGADVPYFLEGGTVLGVDRGDTLFPLIDRPPAWVTLVVPPFGVSTRDAYEWFDAQVGPANRAPLKLRRSAEARRAKAEAGHDRDSDDRSPVNDLESVVAAHHPEIIPLISGLKRAGASHAAMSGSGSAVFGLFGKEREAVDAAGRLKLPGQRVFLARTLSRARYRGLTAVG